MSPLIFVTNDEDGALGVRSTLLPNLYSAVVCSFQV